MQENTYIYSDYLLTWKTKQCLPISFSNVVLLGSNQSENINKKQPGSWIHFSNCSSSVSILLASIKRWSIPSFKVLQLHTLEVVCSEAEVILGLQLTLGPYIRFFPVTPKPSKMLRHPHPESPNPSIKITLPIGGVRKHVHQNHCLRYRETKPFFFNTKCANPVWEAYWMDPTPFDRGV